MTYIIQKSFNNNVLLCNHAESNEETILVGKGIGFGKRPGDTFHEIERVEKMFVLSTESSDAALKELYLSLNEQHLGLVTEAMSFISKAIEQDIPPNKLLSVIDHLVFAIQRTQEGTILENPFKDELRVLFPKEWGIAANVVAFINNQAPVQLPDDEIAFVTMHISSIIQQNKPTESSSTARIVNLCVVQIEEKLQTTILRDSLAYSRLVTHLRFVIERATKGEHLINPMKEYIQEKLKEMYEIAQGLAQFLFESYGITLSDDEISFLALHLARVKNL
ncbi:MAG: PRD domain-containing protein [Bacilli bacterium]